MAHDAPPPNDAVPGSESGAGLACRYAGIVTSLRIWRATHQALCLALRHPACPPQTIEPAREAIVAIAHVLLAGGVVTPEDLLRLYGQETAAGNPHLRCFGYHPN